MRLPEGTIRAILFRDGKGVNPGEGYIIYLGEITVTDMSDGPVEIVYHTERCLCKPKNIQADIINGILQEY